MDKTDLKNYLKITWNDEDVDIQKIIDRGKSYLNRKAGAQLDYLNDLEVQQLLLDYGRYVYNHSFELFETNFKRELLSLSIRKGVEAHVAATTDTETST